MALSIDSALPAVAEPVIPRPTENGEVHQLKAQGKDLSQIAVALNLTSSAVGKDLLIDIPKYPVQGISTPAPGSAISVRV